MFQVLSNFLMLFGEISKVHLRLKRNLKKSIFSLFCRYRCSEKMLFTIFQQSICLLRRLLKVLECFSTSVPRRTSAQWNFFRSDFLNPGQNLKTIFHPGPRFSKYCKWWKSHNFCKAEIVLVLLMLLWTAFDQISYRRRSICCFLSQ